LLSTINKTRHCGTTGVIFSLSVITAGIQSSKYNYWQYIIKSSIFFMMGRYLNKSKGEEIAGASFH